MAFYIWHLAFLFYDCTTTNGTYLICLM